MKGEVIRLSGDEISQPWEELLATLLDQRAQVESDLRQMTAQLVAHIKVTEVLEGLKAEEDDRIRTGLQDEDVQQILYATTRRYRSVDLAEDGLIAQSDTADYPLERLSTGAREQVLLALRMGFASRFASGRPLFMILDDAFQYSDYQRRERLVSHVVRMVEAGWQVTYLTMDDHLLELFREAGASNFEDGFQDFELN